MTIKVLHLTPDYIKQVLDVSVFTRPRPVGIDCKVCGGTFESSFSDVLRCDHCKGTGLEPKESYRVDWERCASHHPNPGYERDVFLGITK